MTPARGGAMSHVGSAILLSVIKRDQVCTNQGHGPYALE